MKAGNRMRLSFAPQTESDEATEYGLLFVIVHIRELKWQTALGETFPELFSDVGSTPTASTIHKDILFEQKQNVFFSYKIIENSFSLPMITQIFFE